MTHPRTAIRNKVHDVLKNGNTKAQTRVFLNRNNKVPPSETIPIILIGSKEDRKLEDPKTGTTTTLERQLPVLIDLYLKQTVGGSDNWLDDEMDLFCKEVEDLIFKNIKLGGLVMYGEYASTQLIKAPESTTPMIGARISFIFTYLDTRIL